VDYAQLRADDLFLECLHTSDESAWVEFMRRFHALIASVAVRVSRHWGTFSPDIIDDLIQDTYLKLCTDRLQIMRNFKPTHEDASYGYVKVFAANMAHDHFKASHARKRRGMATFSTPNNEESVSIAAIDMRPSVETRVLVGQIGDCLEEVTSGPTAKRDRMIFWLYYRVGFSASAIAKLPAVAMSTKGVESTIMRLTRSVRQKMGQQRLTNVSNGGSREGIQSPETL
jgi:RNA polymerase sigma-70 factor (ECF subfamily)